VCHRQEQNRTVIYQVPIIWYFQISKSMHNGGSNSTSQQVDLNYRADVYTSKIHFFRKLKLFSPTNPRRTLCGF
jgi:hypothetical protein